MKEYGFETRMVHAGYEGDSATHSVTPPLYLTNAYYYDDADHARRLFELSEDGNIYTRLGNPTNAFLEKRVASLDGGIGALAFASGHAAILNVILCLCEEGDEFVASINIYGGCINLFGITLKRLGITVKFVNPDNLDEWEKAITDKTKLVFTEVVGNPNANVSDLEAIAKIAHKHGVPFMVDSTFTTPYLCRPIEWGADFVVHSGTKYISGHGQVMSGIVVDGGSFEFKGNKRFPRWNAPDESYHGLVFAELGKKAFLTRLRGLVMRDLGACLSPFNAYQTLLGIETLSLRMERHCENALKVAEFLEGHPMVKRVNAPALPSSPYHELYKKYTPNGAGGVFTFEIKGGRSNGAAFMDNLKLIQTVANVGDIRTQVVHPATTTHSQLSAEQLLEAGITVGTVRITVGIETAADIIDDLKQSLDKLREE